MAQDLPGSLVGRALGHYSLVTLLDTSDIAEVYHARDTRLRREVAVKVLPPALAADPSYVARFRSGAQRMGALHHPNIVPVWEFGEQDGLLYLVMPLEPESLRDRLLRHGTLRIGDAIAVAIQVASALEAAHAQGIVHRDVKPENILLDRDGHALLSGFFFARELASLRRADARPTLAATGLPVGTPGYMAPEQLRDGPIDQRVDIYALGVVLYELLCGVTPHEAPTLYEVAALTLTAPIVPPSEHNPKVWPELEAAVLSALSRDPDRRYFSMPAFAAELRETIRHSIGGRLQARLPATRKSAIPSRASELTRVFVSHSHIDDTFTERLVGDLRSAGADVWVDKSNINYDDFIQRINDGLRGREWLVLVMTPNSLRSQWVEREVNAALRMVVNKQMRGVIPVVASPCPEWLIPPMWATLHRYDATTDYGSALRSLLEVLGLIGT